MACSRPLSILKLIQKRLGEDLSKFGFCERFFSWDNLTLTHKMGMHPAFIEETFHNPQNFLKIIFRWINSGVKIFS